MLWISAHPKANPEELGFIPSFLSEDDPRSASEQINAAYVGGWWPFKGFTMLSNGNLSYPGDPPTPLLWETSLREEVIRLYESSWLAIIQPDGSFEVSRVD